MDAKLFSILFFSQTGQTDTIVRGVLSGSGGSSVVWENDSVFERNAVGGLKVCRILKYCFYWQ